MAMTRHNFDGEEKAPEKHQVFIIEKIVLYKKIILQLVLNLTIFTPDKTSKQTRQNFEVTKIGNTDSLFRK